MRHTAALALTGISLALWTAAAHLTVVVVTRALKSDMYWPWSGRDVGWMVPLAYVVLFALPVGGLALLHAIAPRIARRHWVLGVWAGIGLLAVLLLYASAHSWALALLAVGGGVQLAALYRAREAAVTRVIRRGALLFATFFAVFGGGGALWRGWRARQTLANLPTNAESPNVLLIILDAVRASSLSPYGASRPTTPRLTEWARRGVTFDHAYATTAWTLPSHASMFTGLYASQQSGNWMSRFDAAHRTVAEALRDGGYATGGFVANQLYTGNESGLARGFVTYEDSKRSWAEVLANTTMAQTMSVQRALNVWRTNRWLGGTVRELASFDLRPSDWTVVHAHKAAPDVIRPFLRWQASLGERPFFAFLNFFDAHAAHRTPDPYLRMFNGGEKRRDIYDGSLRYLDDRVGELLDQLERRGVLQNTIVIISADHGELLGEHRVGGHGNSLYRDVLRVPLIVLSGDSSTAGHRVTRQVSLRDLTATILDLTGQTPNALPGHSLAGLWRDQAAIVSPVVAELSRTRQLGRNDPVGKGDMVAVIDDSLHIIRSGDGSLEAFRYRTDSVEAHNLAVGGALPALRAHFNDVYARALHPVTSPASSSLSVCCERR